MVGIAQVYRIIPVPVFRPPFQLQPGPPEQVLPCLVHAAAEIRVVIPRRFDGKDVRPGEYPQHLGSQLGVAHPQLTEPAAHEIPPPPGIVGDQLSAQGYHPLLPVPYCNRKPTE